uniref:Metallo-beta-lactamase domain-containing protein 1 n=1 Tax=Naja naja TaxID=35670 RepID=A0A8C6XIE2_NAJNA
MRVEPVEGRRPAPLALPGCPYSVSVVQEGYCRAQADGSTLADGTVSLVLGPRLTLVDTGGPWARERLLAGLLIVGTDVCQPGGRYLPTGLRRGVLPTPGHTGSDVSLLVLGTALGNVVVAGDLFEHQDDEGEWAALSEDPARQAESRARVLAVADVIVPGHGPPFHVLREGVSGGSSSLAKRLVSRESPPTWGGH